jgi:hypothetical protein
MRKTSANTFFAPLSPELQVRIVEVLLVESSTHRFHRESRRDDEESTLIALAQSEKVPENEPPEQCRIRAATRTSRNDGKGNKLEATGKSRPQPELDIFD